MTDLLAFTLKAPEGPEWEFFLLFVVVICGPPLMQKARIPGIIGLLLGGFLIGPYGLDFITSGNTTVPALGTIGLLYLMFMAGVELDLVLLNLHRRSAITFGLMTFTGPMVLGTLAGLALDFGTASSLLLGSLLASHTLLLYPLLREKGLAADPAIASAVGATVLTDTLALIVLAAVAGSESGSGGSLPSIALQIGGGLILLLAFSLLLLPWIARTAFKYLGRDRTVRYVIVFALFLSAATVAGVVGIEGIVGAFFAGLALNRFVPNDGPLMSRIDFFGSAVFIPVFLVSVGLLLDPSVMIQSETLTYAAVFIAACVGGKSLAAALSVPLLKFSRAQAVAIFALTTPQAAATLAATVVGYDLGLFGKPVVNAVLVLILVSVVLATVVAEQASKHVPVSTGIRRLGDTILVVAEDAARAGFAIRAAAKIAAVDGGVVHPILLRRREAANDGSGLALMRTQALDIGLDPDPRLIVSRSFADAVVDIAAAESASLVLVVDDEDRASPAFGNWGEALAGASPAPVVMVRGEGTSSGVTHLSRVVSGDEGNPAAALAAELASRISGDPVHPEDKPKTAAGDSTIIPVESWEAMDSARPKKDQAVLVVPAPAVPLSEKELLPASAD
jgi:Kef-type K+ transport system membrane component KefB